jgi:hypothetical protein
MRYETLGAILAIAVVSGVAHSCGVDLETATRTALRIILRQ